MLRHRFLMEHVHTSDCSRSAHVSARRPVTMRAWQRCVPTRVVSWKVGIGSVPMEELAVTPSASKFSLSSCEQSGEPRMRILTIACALCMGRHISSRRLHRWPSVRLRPGCSITVIVADPQRRHVTGHRSRPDAMLTPIGDVVHGLCTCVRCTTGGSDGAGEKRDDYSEPLRVHSQHSRYACSMRRKMSRATIN